MRNHAHTDPTTVIVAPEIPRARMNGSELQSSEFQSSIPPATDRERIWNVSQDLLIVADANGNLRSINPAWTTTLGWSEGDLLGRTFDWLCHPDDRARTQIELARLAEGRKTLPFENRFRHKDGSYRWLSWRAVTDRGHLYAVARDVTELKNAEEQLRVSRRELAQVSRQMTVGAMAASIAHEVNQPLAAIVTNANAGLRWLVRADQISTRCIRFWGGSSRRTSGRRRDRQHPFDVSEG